MKSTRNLSVEPISRELISHIEVKLKERFETLQSMKAQANREAAAEVEVNHSDEADVASALESAESSRMMAENLRSELFKIESALERIRMGSFGTCEECDCSIPAKRLEIRPEARLCVDCQAEEERHFGRHASSRSEFAYAS
jgi:DnaK suppressor protein